MEYSDAPSSESTQNPRIRLRLGLWTTVVVLDVGISMVSNVGVEGEVGVEDSSAITPFISNLSKVQGINHGLQEWGSESDCSLSLASTNVDADEYDAGGRSRTKRHAAFCCFPRTF